MFQILLCRIVPVQLFINHVYANLLLNMLKSLSNFVSQKIYRNQNTLGSATHVIRTSSSQTMNACLTKIAKGGGGCRRIDFTRLFISSEVRFKFLYIMCN